jgi:drug/metabolite transporter superfamily protein YnfA
VRRWDDRDLERQESTVNNPLRTLTRLNGWACIGIGVGHVVLGVERSIPGAGQVSPTLESQDAFYNSIFIGYGLTWLRASQDDRPDRVVEAAAVMALGGVARLIAAARRGAPHRLYVGLTAVEFVVPAVVAALARNEPVAGPLTV